MIVDLPFVGPAYESASKRLSAQESLNVYPEVNERSTYPLAFLGRPGRQIFSTIGGTPRALWEMNGVMMAVVGSTVYKIDSAGTATSLGTIAGNERLGVAHNDVTALVCGTGANYGVTTTSVSFVSDIDAPKGTRVGYQNGYWIKAFPDSNKFGVSGIDDHTAWAALDTAFERQLPGNIQAVVADHGELVVFKTRSIGFWVESQNPPATGIPFDRVPQLVIETGVLAADTVVGQLDERIFFLGQQPGATPMVFVLEGRAVRRISTNAIEHQIAKYSGPSAAYAWRFTFEGHPLYLLTFPGQATWAYDVATNEWHQWQNYDRSDYDVTHAVYAYDKNFVMARDGNIYELLGTVYQDAGTEIIRRRTTAPLEAEGRIFSIDSIELECEVGEGSLGDTPEVQIEMSRDGGSTWSNRRSASLGTTGGRVTRARWTGLGATRESVFRVSMTDDVKTVWRSLRADIRVGHN